MKITEDLKEEIKKFKKTNIAWKLIKTVEDLKMKVDSMKKSETERSKS